MKMILKHVLIGVCVFLGQRFPMGRLQQGFQLDACTNIRCCRRSCLLFRPAVGLSVHKGEQNTQLYMHKCTWIHAPLPLSLHINVCVYIWVHSANAYLVKHPVVSDLCWFSSRRLGVQHWYDPEYSNTTAWAPIYKITHLMHKQDI